MPKSSPSQLLADIQANVTRLATCIEIRRKDGKFLRLTSHDSDLTVNGFLYRHDIPFLLSAISTDSQLSVDNTELFLFADGTVIKLPEVQGGLYDFAEVTIFLVDYNNLAHGTMVVRRGWFGRVQDTQNGACQVVITGMTKILDFEVGRVYQPGCDTDLGSKFCKVAIDESQIYSPYNQYHAGTWVYRYNPSLYTSFTVVNSSFEADGFVGSNNPITGWTRTPAAPNSYLAVQNNSGLVGAFLPLDGSFMLCGVTDAGAAPVGAESGVYQDIDLISGTTGLTTANIDGGKIVIGYIAGLIQGAYFLDPVRIAIEIRDASGVIIDGRDTGYIHGKAPLDQFDKWFERGLVFPLRPGSRSARIFIWLRKDDGEAWNGGADKVRLFWWDHTLGSPYEEVVHQMKRVGAFDSGSIVNVINASFEENGLVANADNPTITGWTVGAGNWWQVTNQANGGGLSNPHGLFYLKGGNDGSATQKTYTLTQTRILATDIGLDAARILLGKYVGLFYADVGWTDVSSAATVTIEFLDNTNSVVGSVVVLNAVTNAGAPVWGSGTKSFVIPTTATKVRTKLQATSPVGNSAAGVTFDNVQYFFYDSEQTKKSDPVFGRGNPVTVFNVTPGSYTIDLGEGGLIWKARSKFIGNDVVNTVASDKTFRGTNIAGIAGTFETASILWLSGSNAGLKNLIRTWNPTTKELKLYFKPLYPVQVGDRFRYVRSCQHRFTEDCILIFENGINFRGFPHLPSRIK